MTLWISIAVLTAASLLFLVWPLLRSGRIDGTRAEYDLAVYRDQLAEVEGDLSRGQIGAEEAAAAKREIRRRVIDAEVNDTITGVAGRSPVIAAAVALLILATSGGIYGFLGAPGAEDQPLAERALREKTRLAEGGDIDARIVTLRDRLAENPDDFEGWWLLARSYGFQQRYGEAAEAYRRAVELSNDRPDVLSAYGEAITLANGNKVPQEARIIFEQALRDSADPRARYYLALYEAQQQRFDVAMNQWLALLRDSDMNAPWVPLVRKGIVDMARFQGLAPADVLPAGTSRRSVSRGRGSGASEHGADDCAALRTARIRAEELPRLAPTRASAS